MSSSTPIMIQGCTSDAGKSLLVAGLCRLFANRGERVAPFKAQNMSNHAAVCADGGEIGRAQYLQALAARVVPTTAMNPVLLKPMADTFSQVIVRGRVVPEIARLAWMERRELLWPAVTAALEELQQGYSRLIIEGAGSPAEVNLRRSDIVNMSVALHAGADVYLVADIDRGGAFAHLLGTWHCLSREERTRIKGFVLNKFRGDQALLGNAMDWLQQQTGVPTRAIVPYWRHLLPEEDSFRPQRRLRAGACNIGVIAYPYASNMDEFDPLRLCSGVELVAVEPDTDLQGLAGLILPGSKHLAASRRYLTDSGLSAGIREFAASGKPLLGICGGMQLLGASIRDPLGLEGGDMAGLGLLPVATELAASKITRHGDYITELGALRGYEIHCGRTQPLAGCHDWLVSGLGWRCGNVYGCYLHGGFENQAFCRWFLEMLGWRGEVPAWSERIDSELERLAAMLDSLEWL